jgi:predicted patatin/cPLA2 family phospholipase
MTDGAMRASVPFRAALDEGASHVLALRSRGETYEKYPYKRSEIAITRWFGSKALAKMLVERPGLYNDDARQLQFGGSRTVLQLAPAEREPVAQLEQSLQRLRAGFQLGVNVVGQTFGMPELQVDWCPRPIITAVTN